MSESWSGCSTGTRVSPPPRTEAIEHCRGELVAFLDHDDALTADALMRMAHAFGDADIDVAYSDQDKITASGKRTDPFLKPDWSPVYALGAMYVGHLLVARRDLILEAGGLAPEFDGIQDFELLLRMSERTDRIHHIDRILYHWRAIPGSVALDPSEKPGIDELQARAVNEHLRRRGIRARAVPHGEIEHRLRLDPGPLDPPPSVSVVIPTRGEEARALAPLLERTSYPRSRSSSSSRNGSAEMARPTERALRVDDPGDTFNPGRAANLGAARSSGEWLLFLGEDVEVTERDWIQRLLAHAELPGVGAVAPALTRPDGRVGEAGLAIGLYDPVVPAMQGFPADSDGYYGSLSCAREVSALGMDCLLIRRSDFDRVGGFEEAYSRQHQAHDLCVRLAELGLSCVCAPGPLTITHSTEAQRLADFDVADRALFVERFYRRLQAGDPYYNRGFFRAAADYALPPFGGDPQEIALRETVG